MQYRQAGIIGGKGTGPDRFQSMLRGVALDLSGRVYAVGDREVKVFDSRGQLVRRWKTARPGTSVTVAADGRVLVGEAGHIEIFSGEGKLLDTWKDAEHLGRVTAVALHGEEVFAADARARSIRRFDRTGKFLLTIGDKGRMRGFVIPNGYLDFSIDGEGVIHAPNPGKHRVERYSRTGELLGKFGQFGMHNPAHFRGCCNPTNIAISAAGNIVVTEKAGPRAKVYGRDGKLLALIGEEHFDSNCKNMDVAVDREERLYVADTVRLRVSMFAKIAERAVERPVLEGVEGDG